MVKGESVVAYQRTRWLIRIGFWLALLFASYMAFAPLNAMPSLRYNDTILHAVTFSVLTYGLRLAYFSSPASTDRYFSKAGLIASGWMLLYGVAIEIGQGLTPQRSPELNDLLIDVFGITVGLVAFRLLGPWSLGLARRLIG